MTCELTYVLVWKLSVGVLIRFMGFLPCLPSLTIVDIFSTQFLILLLIFNFNVTITGWIIAETL